MQMIYSILPLILARDAEAQFDFSTHYFLRLSLSLSLLQHIPMHSIIQHQFVIGGVETNQSRDRSKNLVGV
jgi:hypothetical protein